jgi:hypothetical protein
MTPRHFYIFVIISPLKSTWPFIWSNVNLLHPRIICTKFDWILPAGSGEKDFKNSVYFYSFAIISPSRRDIPFVWIKLNPLHQRIICILSLTKFGILVFDKKIFKDFQCIFTRLLLSPLREGLSPSFEETWIPFIQVYFVLSLIEFGLLVLEKKILKKNSVYFHSFAIISPWRKVIPFVWWNLNPLCLRMICAKSG